MLFSERDADVLRLVYWCQYIRPTDLSGITTEEELSDLIDKGLLKLHGRSKALVITGKGIWLLNHMLDSRLPDISQSYHTADIERRLRLSPLALTAYRAGVDIFTCSVHELEKDGKLFLTAHGRGRGQNPWGSTRVAAIAHLGDLVCGFHFIFPGIGKLTLTDELMAFNNNTAHIRDVRRSIIFVGESYRAIVDELARQELPERTTKLVPYKEAYRSLKMPIHLLSCDAVGSRQLKIMSVPHYRIKLTKAALMAHYRPPPDTGTEWDAMFDGSPLTLAVDMDLRRIDAGLAKARQGGFPRFCLLALQEQAGAFLYGRYGEDPFVSIFCLNTATLEQFENAPLELYAPPRTQYTTAKGGVVDTPLIQTYRKAGR